jgi:LysM repeat protein
VIQAQGRFTASTTGSIQFDNLLYEQVTSRLSLRLINTNNESDYISLCERLHIMNSGEKNTEQISGEVQWEGSQTFTTNKCNLIISSGKNENIDITLNGKTLVKGAFTSQQEVRFSTITISPGDTLRVSGTVRYS